MTNWANLASLSRIALIPLIVLCYQADFAGAEAVAASLFIIGSITDWLDGYLARRLNLGSPFCAFLDPVADKLLVGAALVMIAAFDRIDDITLIAAIIILSREILVSGLREFLAEVKVGVPVTTLAKWKTTVQMVAIGFLLAGDAGDPIPAREIGVVGLWVAAVLTLYTGYDYLRAGLRHMTDETEGA